MGRGSNGKRQKRDGKTTSIEPGKELAWPGVYKEGGLTLSLYQPQIEKWDDNSFEALLGVEVQPAGDKIPVYGVVWMSVEADVAKDHESRQKDELRWLS